MPAPQVIIQAADGQQGAFALEPGQDLRDVLRETLDQMGQCLAVAIGADGECLASGWAHGGLGQLVLNPVFVH